MTSEFAESVCLLYANNTKRYMLNCELIAVFLFVSHKCRNFSFVCLKPTQNATHFIMVKCVVCFFVCVLFWALLCYWFCCLGVPLFLSETRCFCAQSACIRITSFDQNKQTNKPFQCFIAVLMFTYSKSINGLWNWNRCIFFGRLLL